MDRLTTLLSLLSDEELQEEIRRRAEAKAQAEAEAEAEAEAQAEAPKFPIGSRVRVLFDAYWRSRIFAELTAWGPADEPLRDNLEDEEGFVSEVFPGKTPGEPPRYGVRTCPNGVWYGGYCIFGEYELEAYTPPTLRSLRTVRAQDLAVGLRVRIAIDGPLRGKTATVVAVDKRPSGSTMAQVQLDEEFQEGVFWALYRLELERLEGPDGQA